MELALWKTMILDRTPNGYLFASEQTTPLDRANVWLRSLEPKLATIGLEWATFQVLQRTNASMSGKFKIDDKVSADQRGYCLGASMEIYSRSDVEQMCEAVARLESGAIHVISRNETQCHLVFDSDFMERETGFEPATSSLGITMRFDY